MITVASKLDPVHEVLWARPYCPWELIPLAAFLCVEDYPDPGREAIVDRLKAGATVPELVADGSIEPEHAEPAAVCLEEGRTEGWMERYRRRGYRLPLPPICGGSDDEPVDRTVPRSAVIIPPELEVLGEILDEILVFDPDDFDPAGTGWECLTDDAPPPMPPIAGGCDGFPRAKTAADKRRDMADVADWYRKHPEG